MHYRRLGRTDLQVSEVGFGAWAIGNDKHGHSYGPTDNAESLRAIKRAFDLGCTFFDTADLYGHGLSEKLLGQALQTHRQACVLATKVGGDFYHGPFRKNFDPDYIRFAVDKSLERLRTDLRLWTAAFAVWTAAAGYVLLQRFPEVGQAIEYHGSFAAFVVCAIQLGSYGATITLLAIGAGRGRR